MNFLNYIDNPLLVGIYAVFAVIGIAHMNDMYGTNTPMVDKIAWWLMTVGAFGVFFFEVTMVYSEWPHIFFGAGGLMMATLNALPRLRAKMANRRVQLQRAEDNKQRRAEEHEHEHETHSHA